MNAKKSNHEPAADVTVAEAGVLARFDRLRQILATTHSRIPTLLVRQREVERELGLSEGPELQKQLTDLVAEREQAARQRSASIAAIMALEEQLQAERARAEQQRQAYAAEAVQEFMTRYSAAVSQLQTIWEEGTLLGKTLRSEIRMPLPVMLKKSVVDDITRAQPILTGEMVAVDPTAAKLGAQVDALDNALGLCGSIRAAEQLEQRAYALAVNRHEPVEVGGVFQVLMPFTSMADGCEFQAGQLIDGSLVGSGFLRRLMTGKRYIAPVALEAA